MTKGAEETRYDMELEAHQNVLYHITMVPGYKDLLNNSASIVLGQYVGEDPAPEESMNEVHDSVRRATNIINYYTSGNPSTTTYSAYIDRSDSTNVI